MRRGLVHVMAGWFGSGNRGFELVKEVNDRLMEGWALAFTGDALFRMRMLPNGPGLSCLL